MCPSATAHRRSQSKPTTGSGENHKNEKQKEKLKHDYIVDHIKGNSRILVREDGSAHFLHCLYLGHVIGD